jgi:hypothetical protein
MSAWISCPIFCSSVIWFNSALISASVFDEVSANGLADVGHSFGLAFASCAADTAKSASAVDGTVTANVRASAQIDLFICIYPRQTFM